MFTFDDKSDLSCRDPRILYQIRSVKRFLSSFVLFLCFSMNFIFL